MKLIALFFVCFLTIVHATSILRAGIESLSDEHVNYINQLNTTWKAAANFRGYKLEELKGLCGSILESNQLDTSNQVLHLEPNDLPKNFDSRKKWPQCADVISHIRDQGSCGSCWAVASASAITDRVCIASNGQNKTQLSAQILTSCCKDCSTSEGCRGGFPLNAFYYWIRDGLPTGGDYGDKNTCAPYLIPPCEHHVEGSRPRCGDIVRTPKCNKKCTNESLKMEEDKNFGKAVNKVDASVNQIKKELLRRGPMVTSFLVYDDFLMYKSGIYEVTEGARSIGGHAVVVIGWGEDEKTGVKYWLAKNNWNSDWGENGYFKIAIGAAQINYNFLAGIPN